MSNDHHKLRILYEVSLSKWRIDDQSKKENQEWCLFVYDRNNEDWIAVNECKRDGEYATIKHIEVIDE